MFQERRGEVTIPHHWGWGSRLPVCARGLFTLHPSAFQVLLGSVCFCQVAELEASCTLRACSDHWHSVSTCWHLAQP